MTQIGMALDIVIAALLVATIVYASVLNRKIAVLRNTRQEMEALVGRLVESTAQAERALAALKAAAGESGGALETRVGEARGLSEDLTFLVEKAGALADRLEGQLGRARAAAPAGRETGPVPANLGRARAPLNGTASSAAASAAPPSAAPRSTATSIGSASGGAPANAARREDGPAGSAGGVDRSAKAATRKAAGGGGRPPGRSAEAGDQPPAEGADESPADAKLLRALRGVR